MIGEVSDVDDEEEEEKEKLMLKLMFFGVLLGVDGFILLSRLEIAGALRRRCVRQRRRRRLNSRQSLPGVVSLDNTSTSLLRSI